MPRNATPHRVIILAGLVLIAVACQDASTAPSPPGSPGTLADGGLPPGGSGDSATHSTPPTPPATSIRLAVHVGIAVAGADTTLNVAAAGARIVVYSRTTSRSTGSGSDTLTISEAVVASGTTDAGGNATFDALPALSYRIEATAAGAAAPPTSIIIFPPYPDKVTTTIIIRPRP
jgi:hypothetical protein